MALRLSSITVRLKIKRGKEGLWYGISEDLKGLLVAESSHACVVEATPKAIAHMYLAGGAETVDVVSIKPLTWIVRPLPYEPLKRG